MFTFVVGTWLFQPTRRVPGTKRNKLWQIRFTGLLPVLVANGMLFGNQKCLTRTMEPRI